mmetsp:Transcript_38121/g.83310  ORF Transcript_38121/g.83310 Transcript_38121/m.83310 type:complete len:255 (-) Transcript_38121:732-1496(-)
MASRHQCRWNLTHCRSSVPLALRRSPADDGDGPAVRWCADACQHNASCPAQHGALLFASAPHAASRPPPLPGCRHRKGNRRPTCTHHPVGNPPRYPHHHGPRWAARQRPWETPPSPQDTTPRGLSPSWVPRRTSQEAPAGSSWAADRTWNRHRDHPPQSSDAVRRAKTPEAPPVPPAGTVIASPPGHAANKPLPGTREPRQQQRSPAVHPERNTPPLRASRDQTGCSQSNLCLPLASSRGAAVGTGFLSAARSH